MRFRQAWCTKIYSDGKHNAFTGIARFGEHYYVCFRNAKYHRTDPESRIVVIRARAGDLDNWETVTTLRLSVPADCRDPKVIVVGSALHAYFPALPGDGSPWGSPWVDYVSVSKDGRVWSEPAPLKGWVDKKTRAMNHWQYRKGPDAYYSVAQIFDEGVKGGVHIAITRSQDGFTWELDAEATEGIMAVIPDGLGPNETDLAFLPDGSALAAIRTEEPVGMVATSRPPYREWAVEYVPVPNFGGPCLWPTRHGVLLCARRYGRGYVTPQTVLWWLSNGQLLNEYALPADGDCSYAGFADGPNGEVLMTYYSGHEFPHADLAGSSANIYLAHVELEEDPVRC